MRFLVLIYAHTNSQSDRETHTHKQTHTPSLLSLSTVKIRLIAGVWGQGGAKHGGWRPTVCDLMGYGSIHHTIGLWELQSHSYKSLVLLAMGLWLSRLIAVGRQDWKRSGRVGLVMPIQGGGRVRRRCVVAPVPCTFNVTKSILLNHPSSWKRCRIWTLRGHTFEDIRLLLHRLPNHFPEAVRDGQTQVLCGHLVGLQHSVPLLHTHINCQL